MGVPAGFEYFFADAGVIFDGMKKELYSAAPGSSDMERLLCASEKHGVIYVPEINSGLRS